MTPLAEVLQRQLEQERQKLEQAQRCWQGELTTQGGKVWCAAGCQGCCTLLVDTTLAEAWDVAHCLSAAQQAAIAAYAERLRQVQQGVTDFKTYLKQQRSAVGPCPLLGADGCCSIYTRRPFACRGLLSSRNSSWCAVDFSTLTRLDKETFLASLDRKRVTFPTHYYAEPQDLAAEAEERLVAAQLETWGFVLRGSFPWLLHLLLQHDLAVAVATGHDALDALLKETGADLPFITRLALA